MGFLGEMLFGKRDKVSVLISIPQRVVSGMETLVYLHNSTHNEIDHISIDEIAEVGIDYVIRTALRLNVEEEEEKPRKEKKQSAKPVYYVEGGSPRGRAQAKYSDYTE